MYGEVVVVVAAEVVVRRRRGLVGVGGLQRGHVGAQRRVLAQPRTIAVAQAVRGVVCRMNHQSTVTIVTFAEAARRPHSHAPLTSSTVMFTVV